MSTIATLVVQLVGNVGDYEKAMDKAESHTRGVLGNLGGVMAGFGAAAAGVFAGVGAAAFSSAMKMDEAYDTIQIGTGATGDALEGLKDDFQAVFTSVPTDAQSAADAVTSLNARLGLTGPILQGTSSSLLEMSRLLGGDVKTNAELFSRVVGDWSVPLEDSVTVLDEMFVASQKTGVGVEQLMRQVVQFGSPMRLMGFTLDESIALFAKWEKEGVNAELVMGSLRIAAGKFAKEGIPLQKGLTDTIEKIKGMTDASAALALGMQVFGARAGPDMVAAIREGRFELGDLVEALQNADGAIMDTAAATEDWPEKWQKTTNKITTLLAPLGMKIMDAIGGALDWLGPRLEALVPIFEQVFEQIGGVIENVVTALGGVVEWVQTNWPVIQQTISDAFEKAQAIIEPILQAIGSIVQAVFGQIALFIQTHGEDIKAFFQSAWEQVQGIIQTLTTIIQEHIVPWLQGIATFIQEHGTTIQTIFESIWNAIKTVVETVLGAIQGIINAVLAVLRGDWEGAWNAIKGVFEGIWNAMKKVVNDLLNAAGGILSIIHDALGGLFSWIDENVVKPITTAWNNFWDGLRAAAERIIGGIVGFVEGLLGALRRAIEALQTLLSLQASAGGPGTNPENPWELPEFPFQHGTGGWRMVPAGFPNDSFRIGLSSGEAFNVAPRGESAGGAQFAFEPGSIVIYGGSQSAEDIARAVMDEAARRADARMRTRG